MNVTAITEEIPARAVRVDDCVFVDEVWIYVAGVQTSGDVVSWYTPKDGDIIVASLNQDFLVHRLTGADIS